ncbi:hypothetical protein SESBI_38931 [Sesbania bispinosa]|nr:hypothetical protein SESBI_38931 [Sesbania bispinosa]
MPHHSHQHETPKRLNPKNLSHHKSWLQQSPEPPEPATMRRCEFVARPRHFLLHDRHPQDPQVICNHPTRGCLFTAPEPLYRAGNDSSETVNLGFREGTLPFNYRSAFRQKPRRYSVPTISPQICISSEERSLGLVVRQAHGLRRGDDIELHERLHLLALLGLGLHGLLEAGEVVPFDGGDFALLCYCEMLGVGGHKPILRNDTQHCGSLCPV